jgi:hypothetical protein
MHGKDVYMVIIGQGGIFPGIFTCLAGGIYARYFPKWELSGWAVKVLWENTERSFWHSVFGYQTAVYLNSGEIWR